MFINFLEKVDKESIKALLFIYNKNVNGANEKSPQTATSVHKLMLNTNRDFGNRAVSCFYY